MVYVSWDNAVAFCKWATTVVGARYTSPLSIRLPTEAEWEKAARGTDGRLFPWGNEPPDQTRCNFGQNVGDTTPVGRYSPRGDSPYGCADLAGNVSEWCADWYGSGYYRSAPARNPPGPANGEYRVVRGGAFSYAPHYLRAAHRSSGDPISRYGSVGFRCVVGSPGK